MDSQETGVHNPDMTKCLQILLDQEEYAAVASAAKSVQLSVSAWVRLSLAEALRTRAAGNTDQKILAVQVAAAHDYPTADIGEMLEQIGSGYRQRTHC